jgi:hypothetical protein
VLTAALLLLPAIPQAGMAQKAPAAPPAKLEIKVLITAEPEQVFSPKKGPDGKFAPAEPVKIAPRGKQIAAVIYFKDCKADAASNCNVDVDLQGIAPDGSLFQNRKGAELWRGKVAPAAGITQLGTQYMKMQIEATDPAGTYRVVAVAHDRNNGATSRSEATFEVK